MARGPISMSHWSTCCFWEACIPIAASQRDVPWCRKIPASRGTQTEVLRAASVPPQEVTVPQSSLCLWNISVVLSYPGQPEATAPPCSNAGAFHSRERRETWRCGYQFPNNKILKAVRKASCMENQTEQEKQRLPSA